MRSFKIANVLFAMLLLSIVMPCGHDGVMAGTMNHVSGSNTNPVSEAGARVEGRHGTVVTTQDDGPFPANGGHPTCTIAFNNSALYIPSGAYIRIFANFTENGSGINPDTVRINITYAGNLFFENYSMDILNNTRWYYNWTVLGYEGP